MAANSSLESFINFEEEHKVWVENASMTIDMLIFLSDCHESDFEDLEVQKSKHGQPVIDLSISHFIAPRVFRFLFLSMQKSLGKVKTSISDIDIDTDENLQDVPNINGKKKVKFVHKMEELILGCEELYFSLLNYAKSFEVSIELNELINHFKFFENNIGIWWNHSSCSLSSIT